MLAGKSRGVCCGDVGGCSDMILLCFQCFLFSGLEYSKTSLITVLFYQSLPNTKCYAMLYIHTLSHCHTAQPFHQPIHDMPFPHFAPIPILHPSSHRPALAARLGRQEPRPWPKASSRTTRSASWTRGSTVSSRRDAWTRLDAWSGPVWEAGVEGFLGLGTQHGKGDRDSCLEIARCFTIPSRFKTWEFSNCMTFHHWSLSRKSSVET